ncbi:NAD-dependent epimerase [Parvibium lacunae]|uniref:NAD-dependent epimerase n=1 Tax=Parvibium lacunae TaxID=1888893 RepID=A0A368L1F0_9BURK|nr:NAD-dependent epimerase [Parvibium lacunae]RCS57397.1 NAD-dependent epimerase [Parvibium lacunae]
MTQYVLVTGCAGFIGMHLSERLLREGYAVVGVDNLNDYYSVALKQARLARLLAYPQFSFFAQDLTESASTLALFQAHPYAAVCHLAAQPGVRYSLKNPQAYIQANVVAFTNVLEGARLAAIPHLVFASSSSVYGGNAKTPFAETDPVDHPVSLYAATKKANELMAHTYSHLYQLPCTGLRFFTVYGPWGRPDMSPMIFARAILRGETLQVFNGGDMARDFTYVDDIVEGVLRILWLPAQANPDFDPYSPDPASSQAPYRIYNIGNHTPVPLLTYIETLEQALGQTAPKAWLPMQAGDVLQTYADTSRLQAATSFAPQTPLAVGLGHFVAWLREHPEFLA